MRTPGRAAPVAGALLLAGAVVLGGSTAFAADGPAPVYVPSADERLAVGDLRLVAAATDGRIRIVSRTGQPLAVLAVQNDGPGDVRLARRGADFTEPSIWRDMGFGDMCWRITPTASTTELTLPAPDVPFRAVPNVWAYSTVVVMTEGGPIVYKRPKHGQTVSGQGREITGGVVCLKAVVDGRGLRADPTDSSAPATASTTPAGAPAPAPVSTSAVPATLSPRPSPSPATASATASSAPPAPVTSETGQQSDDKVTLCHATSSASNPYNLVTVSVSALNGHAGHTGPLYPQYGWGDVIPPTDGYPGMNWPAGAALVDAGCVVPPDPTASPTPTGTEEPPLATDSPGASPSPTTPPGGWPVWPQVPSTLPAPVRPPVIVVPTPTPTPTPIPTPVPSPSGTATSSASPAPSTDSSSTSSTSAPSTAAPAAPGATEGPGASAAPTQTDAATAAAARCSAAEGVPDSKVRIYVTNGVSRVELTRSFTRLLCLAQGRSLPGGDSDTDSGDGSPAATSNDDLAVTGADTSSLLIAGTIMVAMGLLFVPTITRRRR